MIAPSGYCTHPGKPHEWSHPIPALAGGHACRTCGQLNPGTPFGPGPSAESKAAELEVRFVSEPHRACPRFDKCNVNACPLDPKIEKRTFDPDDRETKCPLGKQTRQALFAQLPAGAQARLSSYGGLFKAEFTRGKAAKARYARMTREQRARLAAHGVDALSRYRRGQLSLAGRTAPEGTPDSSVEPSTPQGDTTNGGETA